MSGWTVEYRQRWRFYPVWMPWGCRRIVSYVHGGHFVYGD